MQASLSRVSTCRCLCESCRRLRLATPRSACRRRGTDGSNSVPSSGESGELPYCAAGSSRFRRTPADLLAITWPRLATSSGQWYSVKGQLRRSGGNLVNASSWHSIERAGLDTERLGRVTGGDRHG